MRVLLANGFGDCGADEGSGHWFLGIQPGQQETQAGVQWQGQGQNGTVDLTGDSEGEQGHPHSSDAIGAQGRGFTEHDVAGLRISSAHVSRSGIDYRAASEKSEEQGSAFTPCADDNNYEDTRTQTGHSFCSRANDRALQGAHGEPPDHERGGKNHALNIYHLRIVYRMHFFPDLCYVSSGGGDCLHVGFVAVHHIMMDSFMSGGFDVLESSHQLPNLKPHSVQSMTFIYI